MLSCSTPRSEREPADWRKAPFGLALSWSLGLIIERSMNAINLITPSRHEGIWVLMQNEPKGNELSKIQSR